MGILEDKGRAQVFYRYLSSVYDEVNKFVWTERMRDDAVDWLGLEGDERVLDVGCGTGFATAGLVARVETVIGVDQSVHQLQRAGDRLGKYGPVAFQLGDAERLPYRSNSFDVVWSSGAIEYWPSPVATLEELRRVLRPGGTILVVGPHEPKNRVLRRLADAIMLFYDEDTADHMFDAAGFTEVTHRIDGPRHWPTAAIVTRARNPPD